MENNPKMSATNKVTNKTEQSESSPPRAQSPMLEGEGGDVMLPKLENEKTLSNSEKSSTENDSSLEKNPTDRLALSRSSDKTKAPVKVIPPVHEGFLMKKGKLRKNWKRVI